MVLSNKTKFAITRCNCGKLFQGYNFKKHLQKVKNVNKQQHESENTVYYCPKCNEWANEGEVFSHPSCPYLSFPKSDLLQIIKKVSPISRHRLLSAAEKEEEQEAEEAAANIMDEIFGDVSSDSDKQPQPLTRKRVDLDDSLDDSASSDFQPSKRHQSTPEKRHCPSPSFPHVSPIKPHLPSQQAVRVDILHAKNTLMDENCRLKKSLSQLQAELAIYKAKELMVKRLEEENRRKSAEAKTAQEGWKKEKDAREKEQREHEETVKKLKTECERKMEETSEGWKKKLEKAEGEEAKEYTLIHLELGNGCLKRRHAEYDPNCSTLCYSNETTKTRCVHVEVTGRNTFTRVRNVRWPCEGKLNLRHEMCGEHFPMIPFFLSS